MFKKLKTYFAPKVSAFLAWYRGTIRGFEQITSPIPKDNRRQVGLKRPLDEKGSLEGSKGA